MIAAVAPLGPAVGEGVGAVMLLLAWAVAFGLLYVYRSTLGRVVLAVADRIEGVGISTRFGSIHPLDPLADALRWADAQIRDGLGIAVANTERGATWLFHTLKAQLADLGEQIGGLAYDVSHAIDRTITVTIPHAVGRVERRLGRDIALTRTLARSTATTVAHDLPLLRREVADWKGYTRRMLRRLRRLEKLLAPAAFAAAVAVALNRLGLNWLRCPSLNRISRRHGCSPWRLLELLLATTVPALVLGNVCQLVKYAEQGAVAVEPSLSALVATGENFICGGDTDGPSGIVAADRHDSTLRPSGWLAADLAGSSV